MFKAADMGPKAWVLNCTPQKKGICAGTPPKTAGFFRCVLHYPQGLKMSFLNTTRHDPLAKFQPQTSQTLGHVLHLTKI